MSTHNPDVEKHGLTIRVSFWAATPTTKKPAPVTPPPIDLSTISGGTEDDIFAILVVTKRALHTPKPWPSTIPPLE
jgi:hypothetical protein